MKQKFFKTDAEVAAEIQAIQQQTEQQQATETMIEGAKVVPGLGKSVEQNSPLAAVAEAI